MAVLGRLARRRELRSLTGGVVSGEGAVTGSFSWVGMGVEEVAEVEVVEVVVDVRRGWTTRG